MTNLGSVPGIARLPATLIMLNAVLLYAAMIAKRVNETGRIYRNDLQEIQDSQNRIWDGINKILRKLQSVQ